MRLALTVPLVVWACADASPGNRAAASATLTTVWQPPGEPAPQVVSTTVPALVEQAPAGPGSKPIFEERLLGGAV